jgi:hypothetical protein
MSYLMVKEKDIWGAEYFVALRMSLTLVQLAACLSQVAEEAKIEL